MLRKFFASFFSFLFINFTLAFLFILSISQTVFDENFYRTGLSPFLRDVLIDEITKEVNAEDISLSKTEFKTVLKQTFSEEDIFMAMENAYQGINEAEVVDGEMKVNISFLWLKQKNQVFAQNLADVLYAKLESCESSEDFDQSGGITCLPKNFSKEDLSAVLARELDLSFFSQIPGSYVFDVELPADFDANSVDFFTRIISNLLLAFGFFSLVLLVLVALSIFSPLPRVFKWIFSALFSASVLGIIFFSAIEYFGGTYASLTEAQLESVQSSFIPDFIDIIASSIRNSALKFLVPVFVFSLFALIVLHFKFKNDESVGANNTPVN